jgi:hypothetical protein
MHQGVSTPATSDKPQQENPNQSFRIGQQGTEFQVEAIARHQNDCRVRIAQL